jgi:hypothetical protein
MRAGWEGRCKDNEQIKLRTVGKTHHFDLATHVRQIASQAKIQSTKLVFKESLRYNRIPWAEN